jgi:hypothetical protein
VVKLKRLFGLGAASVILGLAAFGGSAAASPPTTPNGYVGAWNMLQDPTMATGPMGKDNPNGNAGMCTAVLVSSGTPCP